MLDSRPTNWEMFVWVRRDFRSLHRHHLYLIMTEHSESSVFYSRFVSVVVSLFYSLFVFLYSCFVFVLSLWLFCVSVVILLLVVLRLFVVLFCRTVFLYGHFASL